RSARPAGSAGEPARTDVGRGRARRAARLADPRLPARESGRGQGRDRMGRDGGLLVPRSIRADRPRRARDDAARHGDGRSRVDRPGRRRELLDCRPARRVLPVRASGDAARRRPRRPPGTGLDARAVSQQVGAASALKATYAAWTKGTAATLLAIEAVGKAEGVWDALLEEWQLSQPDLLERSLGARRSADAEGL